MICFAFNWMEGNPSKPSRILGWILGRLQQQFSSKSSFHLSQVTWSLCHRPLHRTWGTARNSYWVIKGPLNGEAKVMQTLGKIDGLEPNIRCFGCFWIHIFFGEVVASLSSKCFCEVSKASKLWFPMFGYLSEIFSIFLRCLLKRTGLSLCSAFSEVATLKYGNHHQSSTVQNVCRNRVKPKYPRS